MNNGLKISDSLFLVNSKKAGSLERLKEKIDKKLIRLYENNKIDIENSYGISINFFPLRDYIKNNKNKISGRLIPTSNVEDFYAVEVGLPELSYSNWSILGAIELIEDTDEFILKSYSKKDLPIKYRKLEDPNNCEHCNQKRKRNKTFVVQNEQTNEVLQVGSACMEDYISPTDLKLLVKLSDFFNEVQGTILKDTDSLEEENDYTNKVIFLGLMDYIEEKREEIGTYENEKFKSSNDSNSLSTFNLVHEMVFNSEISSRSLGVDVDYLSGTMNNEDIYERGQNICSFYINRLGYLSADFCDGVNNTYRMISSDIDFWDKEEIKVFENAIKYKSIIENNSPLIKEILSDYVDSITINEKTFIKSGFSELEYAIKFYFSQYDLINKNNIDTVSNYSNFWGVDINDFGFLLEKVDDFKNGKLEGKEKIQMMDFSSFVEDNFKNIDKEYNDFINFIKDEKYYSGLLDYDGSKNLIYSISNNKNLESNKNLTSLCFLRKSFLIYKEKEELKKDFSAGCFVGAKKERIENIELKVKNKKTYDGDFGLTYTIWCEDVNKNNFAIKFSSNLPKEFEGENFENHKEKWASFSGTISWQNVKRDYKTGLEKNVNYLNRVKLKSEFKDTPNFESMIFKSKGENLTLTVDKKEDCGDKLKNYMLKTDDGKTFNIRTKEDLPEKFVAQCNVFGEKLYIKKINKKETSALKI